MAHREKALLIFRHHACTFLLMLDDDKAPDIHSVNVTIRETFRVEITEHRQKKCHQQYSDMARLGEVNKSTTMSKKQADI